MPMTKEERREYNKKYNIQNKDKIKEQKKKYYQENREKFKEINLKSNRRWMEKNREKERLRHKENYYKNKEYFKKYFETEKWKKSNTINSWKNAGMLCEDWDSLYEIYLHTWNCDYCKCEIDKSINKHLDHDHSNGTIRGILCRSCNAKDVLA